MPKAKTPKKTPISKSNFIRQQPASLSAAEVVAKGKAEGVTILRGLVYEVRRMAKARATGTPAAQAVPVSATKVLPLTKSPKSKAAFVRGLPASTPAKDVVKQAKAAGIMLGISYVYNIRGAAKKKRGAAKSRAVVAVTNTRSWSISEHAETLLRAVGAEIGLGRAIELLHGERDRVHSILR
jgi:hypothetical protein